MSDITMIKTMSEGRAGNEASNIDIEFNNILNKE